MTDFNKEFIDHWAVEWNNIDIEGADFFKKQGGQIISIANTEAARWVKASEPGVNDFKKDLVNKGYKAAKVDSWTNFVGQRIEYWKGQEKARRVPTAYQD